MRGAEASLSAQLLPLSSATCASFDFALSAFLLPAAPETRTHLGFNFLVCIWPLDGGVEM